MFPSGFALIEAEIHLATPNVTENTKLLSAQQSNKRCLKSVNVRLGRDRDSLSRHGWLVCQHDLAARDDRDPSQNSAMAGQEHPEERGEGWTGGPGQGTGPVVAWHTAGLLDRLYTVWFKPPPIQPRLEEPAWAKSTITGFLVGVM